MGTCTGRAVRLSRLAVLFRSKFAADNPSPDRGPDACETRKDLCARSQQREGTARTSWIEDVRTPPGDKPVKQQTRPQEVSHGIAPGPSRPEPYPRRPVS